jgi:hypothetical protein
MHESYDDIRSRIQEEPKWWDEHAVPRYCDFSPDKCADIYCDEAALVEIACQNCGTHFLVAFTSDRAWWAVKQMDRDEFRELQTKEEQLAWIDKLSKAPLRDAILLRQIHYGDPPNARCCPAGPTMNCDDLRVCEYWSRDNGLRGWKRNPQFEIVLDTVYES